MKMRSPRNTLLSLSIVLTGFVGAIRAEQILLHEGPIVETPTSSPIAPLPEMNTPKMIKFRRNFYLDQDLIVSLPQTASEYGTIPVSAIDAINLAKKDVDPQDGLRSWIVTEVRLLRGPVNHDRQIEYYFIAAQGNGSEYHRVVLMDRTVITSKLQKIEE